MQLIKHLMELNSEPKKLHGGIYLRLAKFLDVKPRQMREWLEEDYRLKQQYHELKELTKKKCKKCGRVSDLTTYSCPYCKEAKQ